MSSAASAAALSNEELYVIKRNGETEVLSFDKILQRVKHLGTTQKPTLNVNYSQLVMKIVDQLYNNIPTHIIDELMAERDKVYDIHQDNELEAIAAYEKKKQEEEKEHTRRITEYFKGTGSSSWALRNKNSDPMEETSSDSFIKQF